jgi:predicted Zn-ribbon and HTH transcriptional regulator
MAKSPNWSPEDLEKLREMYPRLGKSIELLEIFPGRTLNAIALKASRLGIIALNNPRKGRSNEEYVHMLIRTNFEALEQYKGSTEPILHRCKLCEHQWLVRPQHTLKKGARCPECDLKNRRNSEAEVLNTLSLAGMTKLSEYTGTLDPLKLRHEYCGYEWVTKYSHIQQGSGCPVCNKGFGYINGKAPEYATLYLLHISTSTGCFLKIGVTVQPIKRRVSELSCRLKGYYTDIGVEVLYSIEHSGEQVLRREARILQIFEKHTTNRPLDGYTECLGISNNIDKIKEVMNENI